VTWHARRHRAILRDHPQLRELFGADPSSAVWVVVLGAAQIALAFWAAREPVWVSVSLSVTVGAAIAHGLGVLIHEASHNLVLRGAAKNKLVAIAANLALAAPAAIEFRRQHMLHHKYLGESGDPDGRDTQAPTRKEVLVVGHSGVLKLLSLSFGRFVYKARPANSVPHDAWFFGNLVACVLADATIALAGGVRPLAFLILSALVAFGPHVLGARRVSEHLTIRRGQPTNSYYGPLNRIAFDVGYHVEHHDFPAIPWRRLRELHAVAYEQYETLAAVPSWAKLMAAYLFDRRYTVAQYTGVSEEYLEELRAP
jgi:sphingolipid delta-4 desaturase